MLVARDAPSERITWKGGGRGRGRGEKADRLFGMRDRYVRSGGGRGEGSSGRREQSFIHGEWREIIFGSVDVRLILGFGRDRVPSFRFWTQGKESFLCEFRQAKHPSFSASLLTDMLSNSMYEYLEELSKVFQRKRFLNVFERDNFFRDF